jgi:V8-like Glu-specific endopeptidase
MTKILGIAIALISTTAFALDFPINKNLAVEQLPPNFTVQYDFEGIVALSNCSGSLIQLEGAADASQALVLTNGHCLEGGFSNPGQFKYKQPSTRTFTLLKSDATNAGRVTATEIVYSTMTGTDVTIYKLRETYAEIKAKFGIRPMTLSSQHPTTGTSMEVVSGYWKRGYACAVEAFIPQLKEAGWIMTDSIRYSRPGCETIGGTSGSPILQAGTKTVIGINNTGNEDGQRCTMNNPCEIDKDGNISFVQGYSYGQQTYQIYSCVTATNDIDLSVPGCQLLH